jgi:DNA-binding CsgD family transcriptional regulator
VDPVDIIASTAEAAFGTDEDGRIVIWNRAAERLVGVKAEAVLSQPCHEVICGKDAFGNRFCDEHCALTNMAVRKEAIGEFTMEIPEVSGVRFVSITVMVVPGPRSSQFTIIHILRPVSDATGQPGGVPWRAGVVPMPRRSSREAAQAKAVDAQVLTERELEVLNLLAKGTSTRDIADLLFISVSTVRSHVQSILSKLEAHSKLEAVAVALQKRLI